MPIQNIGIHALCSFVLFFWLTPAFSDSEIFACKVNGVVSFQSEPCQALLDGKNESEEAQSVVVDTQANTVKSPDATPSSDLVQRARNLEKYKYQQERKHNFDSPNYYYYQSKKKHHRSRESTYSENSDQSPRQTAKQAECDKYRSAAKRYQSSARKGYSSRSSNSMKRESRQIQSGIISNCY